MKSIIDDPEVTERLLKDGGFEVALRGEAFEVTLKNRKLHPAEVADVLQCEPDNLQRTPHGVLVR